MLSCEHHDYIEIVCMFHYPVTLTLKTGQVVSGIALDTVRNEAKAECIKLEVGEDIVFQELDTVKTLEVDIKNPHFQKVAFQS